MILDAILIISSLLAVIMAWKVNIQLNFFRFVFFLIFCSLLLYLAPFFLTFMEKSTVNVSNAIWYIFGISSLLLIFGGFWIVVKKNTIGSGIFNRIFGSIIFGVIVFTSMAIIVFSLKDAEVVHVSDSRVFDLLNLK